MSIDQKIFCKSQGKGIDLVLLHGWGVNSSVWDHIIEELSQSFCVHSIDLPGFGLSDELQGSDLNSIVDLILKKVPTGAIWCGWSLGGLIAIKAAYLYPNKISKLILVSASPKFVKSDDWNGVDASVFDNFKIGLTKNIDKTLGKFISIQAMGSPTVKSDIKIFKKLLSSTKIAKLETLISGLDLLGSSDLRTEFSKLQIPCLSIFGKMDQLVPIEDLSRTKNLLPSSQLKIFENSSHAAFISEPTEFCNSLKSFALD